MNMDRARVLRMLWVPPAAVVFWAAVSWLNAPFFTGFMVGSNSPVSPAGQCLPKSPAVEPYTLAPPLPLDDDRPRFRDLRLYIPDSEPQFMNLLYRHPSNDRPPVDYFSQRDRTSRW